jgi:CDP-diacylglycerol--serine O-phosphatidyltransferase
MIKRPTITSDGMRKGIYVLPNLFTTASLFCGFYAIIASMRENFFYAAVSILIAGILDGLDGRIARFTNTTSKFGSEYDSLADLVAFGVAPGILAYTWALSPFGRYGWLVSFLFVACGALRLARFNIQIGIVESKVFNGLPIPAAAGVVAGSVLFYDYVGGTGHFHHISILLAVVALAFLMVSNIKFYSFKDVNYFSRKPFITLVLVVFVFTVIVMEPQLMIFTMAVGYACSGPAWSLYKLLRRNKKAREEVKKSVNNV